MIRCWSYNGDGNDSDNYDDDGNDNGHDDDDDDDDNDDDGDDNDDDDNDDDDDDDDDDWEEMVSLKKLCTHMDIIVTKLGKFQCFCNAALHMHAIEEDEPLLICTLIAQQRHL